MKKKNTPWIFVDPTVYVGTKSITADGKGKLAADIAFLIHNDFSAKDFPGGLYWKLNSMFGFIAHFDREGFMSAHFSSTETKVRFLEQIENWRPVGDPSCSLSDVEMSIQAWVKSDGLVAKTKARLRAEEEVEERALLAKLKAKYEGPGDPIASSPKEKTP